jgi:hypothetical protein
MTRQSVGIALGKAGGFVATRPDWFLERVANMNTTNVRILFTILVFGATALRYLTATDGWEPSLEWLGMLLGMAGIDAAQWLGKRKTSTEYVAAQARRPEDPPHNGAPPEGSARPDELRDRD